MASVLGPKSGTKWLEPSTSSGRFVVTKDQLLFVVLLTAFWFGVVFYGMIEIRLGFTYTDELCTMLAVASLIYFKIIKVKKIQIQTIIVLSVLLFYFVYSVLISSNLMVAILSDAIVFAKPFIAMLAYVELDPKFSMRMAKAFRISAIIASGYLLMVGVCGIRAQYFMFKHPSQFAGAAMASSVLYLLNVKFSKKSLIVHSMIMGICLLSLRSKSAGIMLISLAVLWGAYNSIHRKKFKFQIKYIFLFFGLASLAAFAARKKVYLYFIAGLSDINNLLEARSALYITSLRIAKDYFPFGSGFASFASWFSGVYYSKLYEKYMISNIWGLSRSWFDFVSDTFYPQLLGQFGVVGIFLMCYFLGRILIRAYKDYRKNGTSVDDGKNLYIVFFIITYFSIESVADSTFVGNRGLFMMMVLGVTVYRMKHKLPASSDVFTGKTV